MRLQAEKKEFVLLPDTGELVEVAAKETHKEMDDDQVTDFLPDGSYIFSNTPSMKLHREDFDEYIISEKLPIYREGMKPEKYKEYNFADTYFNSKTNTPAEVVKNIHKKHKVITDDEQKYNPFIQVANDLNKQNRAPHVALIKEVSELIKPTDEPVETPTFKYGGKVKNKFKTSKYKNGGKMEYYMHGGKLVPKYQSFGSVSSGALSGAAAGSFLGPLGTIGGALIGGIGSFFTGRSENKNKERQLREFEAMQREQRGISSDISQAQNLGTFAQAAIPNYINERADYSGEISRVNNTYDDIGRGFDNSTTNQIAQALGAGNTALRSARGQLTGPQFQNLSANVVGKGISSANSINANRENLRNKFKIDRTNSLNTLTLREGDINRDYTNAEGYAEVDKVRRVASDLTNNRVDDLNRKSALSLNDFQGKRAIELGSAAQLTQAQGAFNNSLLLAGQVGSNIINTRNTNTAASGVTGGSSDPAEGATSGVTAGNIPDHVMNGNVNNLGWSQISITERMDPNGNIYVKDPYTGGWKLKG